MGDLEFLLVLIGIALLAVPILLIVLLFRVADLRRRVNTLENAAAQAAVVAPGTNAPKGARQDTAPPKPAAPPRPPTTPQQPEPPPIPASAGRDKTAVWPGAKVDAPQVPPMPQHLMPPKGPGPAERLISWLTGNWFYAVSAVSLALAGLFMVQYGIENGLIPPVVRVLAALAFGAALIGGGEYLRRRFGDDDDSTTAYLPSVFSAAGIVSLFGGILSARLLYGLIGPELALVGLAGTALVAMVLGWFNGPLLAAVGVVGGFVAPMIVGGSSQDPTWVYLYFAAIAGLGLGIDTLRRWAWVSALSLAMGFGMGWLLASGAGNTSGALALYVFVLAMFAVLIPCRALSPDHQGSIFLNPNWGVARPIFPTLLSMAGLAAASATLFVVSDDGADTFWLSVILLSVLGIAWILWSDNAPALQDQPLLPLGALFFAVLAEGGRFGSVARPFVDTSVDPALAPAGPAYPFAFTALVALGGLWSLAAAWRSWKGGDFAAIWAGAAALIAPAMAILLDMVWLPNDGLSAYAWALHAAAIAALMVVLAERFAKLDGEADRLRAGLFTLSALSALTFACVILLSSAALTVAFAVAVVAAAWLDKKFDLAPMVIFIGVGVLTLGYRLLADPGLDWGVDATWPGFALAYGGSFAAVVAALTFARARGRATAIAVLDSAAWSVGGMFVTLFVFRAIDQALGGVFPNSHWAIGLYATIWILVALAQLNIARRTKTFLALRFVLAAVFGVMAAGAILIGTLVLSPLMYKFAGLVAGPVLINTLIPAYLFPALALGVGALRIGMPRWLQRVLGGVAVLLAAYWLFAEIRHFWQGAEAMELWRGFSQPEMSTYTVAVLLIGAGLFYQSLARANAGLRRAGLVVIGLAVAKVFLIDIGSLGGLIRVFSFLLLGFALAGLAWLNNWAQKNEKQHAAEDPPAP